ncbi:MAG TPA: hypothetical protein VKA38_08540 [Draconibacterium sp.]|nr:hypothetical protein [Draconibacterium sp.]
MNNQAVLTKVTIPGLALYGELDQQVNQDKNIRIIEQALKQTGINNFTLKRLAGLNHLFQTAQTGLEYEYIKIEETISLRALEVISGWIVKQVN